MPEQNNAIQTVETNEIEAIIEKGRQLSALQRTQGGAKPSYKDAINAVMLALEIQSQPGISEANFFAAQKTAINVVKNSAAMDIAADVDENLQARLQAVLNQQG
jgi:hypothetical protein